MSDLTRRQLLLGAGAALLAGCASKSTRDTTGPDVEVVSGSFRSAARRREVGWSLAKPRRAATPLPLVVVLHGRGGDHHGAFDSLHLDRTLAELIATGGAPLAVASVDGGDHTYYHRRADGDDPARMITDELIPLLQKRFGLSERVGLAGWSMGGYGALLLAQTYGPQRFPVVAASSAALWRRWEDSAPGAFDGPSDFAAHDVLGDAPTKLARTAVRLACGHSDPFYATNQALARALPSAGTDFRPGTHRSGFWRATDLGQLRFLTGHLST